ncbi:MAG: hypothetical protein MI741_20715, partial [Rhodospirillales bacterium]|nr:hypothetical protein [Rhodospirillales bacterium]
MPAAATARPAVLMIAENFIDNLLFLPSYCSCLHANDGSIYAIKLFHPSSGIPSSRPDRAAKLFRFATNPRFGRYAGPPFLSSFRSLSLTAGFPDNQPRRKDDGFRHAPGIGNPPNQLLCSFFANLSGFDRDGRQTRRPKCGFCNVVVPGDSKVPAHSDAFGGKAGSNTHCHDIVETYGSRRRVRRLHDLTNYGQAATKVGRTGKDQAVIQAMTSHGAAKSGLALFRYRHGERTSDEGDPLMSQSSKVIDRQHGSETEVGSNEIRPLCLNMAHGLHAGNSPVVQTTDQIRLCTLCRADDDPINTVLPHPVEETVLPVRALGCICQERDKTGLIQR